MTTENIYKLFLQHPLISTDTRNIVADSLFFALKGENFDANTFANQAIEAGAAYAIIDNATYQINDKYILVDDALTALQDLARHHRRQLTIPVIGLTGSNGKTTTKELIYAVLSQHFKTQATIGNLNNHIGVPLTILTINQEHQLAIIEMGANHQKEIELLCSICQPTHALITNIGKAHLEGFGGIEGVKKGKGELYDYMKNLKVEKLQSQESMPVTFVNSDSQVLMGMQQSKGVKNVIRYGSGGIANLVTGNLTENSPYVSLQWTNNNSNFNYTVKTKLTGPYNLDNMLAAICIGVYFNLTDDEINRGIEDYQPKNNRSQIVETDTNILICDFYNANPSSMFAAIENIGTIKANRKVIILGDMFEMGIESVAEHEAVIKKALGSAVDQMIFIGKDFYKAYSSFNHTSFEMKKKPIFYQTSDDAIIALTASHIKNSTILIKGSRGMALERLTGLF